MSFFTNKTVIVTGASLGIGRALSILLAELGAKLVLNARTEATLAEAAAACTEKGAEVRYVAGDASKKSVTRALVETAGEMGGTHGFFHVAGVFAPGPLLYDLREEDFDAVMNSNVKAAYQLVRHATPDLLAAPEPFAVFFGSGVSTITQTGIAAYCVAKAAEEHLMRQYAAEVPHVTTFAYQPSIVETRMQKQARESEGSGADALHEKFRPWKEHGDLITPEMAAQGLINIFERGAREFHGEVTRWNEDLM